MTATSSAQEAVRKTTYSSRPTAKAGIGVDSRRREPSGRPASVRAAGGEAIIASEAMPLDSQVIEEPIGPGEYIVGEHGHAEGAYCSTCRSPRRLCICFPAHGWVHAEYLQWWQNGFFAPPLVTTGGATRATAGVLGQPGTSVLFGGNDDILDGSRPGGRIRFGWWFEDCPGWGVEGEYVGVGNKTESFFRQSTGTPVLARPFFNMLTGREDSELVAFTNVLSGSVAVDAASQFNGAAARFRKNLCCSSGCGIAWMCGNSVPVSTRLDGTIGYRFYELAESLQVRERLQSLDTTSPGSFDIIDRFESRNQFNGGEIGVLWQGRRGWWSLDALMRLGIGNNHQTVTISGSTTTVENGTTASANSGIFTQRTNIGTHDRDQFGFIPELGLTLGYQLTQRTRLTVGYSLIYWEGVVRPGDQIDTDLNPNLFPPEQIPFTGPLRPQFQFVESDYWLQGLNFGAEFRW